MTKTGTTFGMFSTTAYMMPSGKKIGTIPAGTSLPIIGTTKGPKEGVFVDSTDVDFFAVEYTIGGNKTVFVDASDLHLT